MGQLKTRRGEKTVAIPLQAPAMTIGSEATCQIVVHDAGTAPRHCQILKTDQGFLVRDLSGSFGTFVNGKRIKEHALREGDVLQVGGEKFAYGDKSGNTGKIGTGAQARPATGRVPAQPAPTGNTARVQKPAAPSGNTGRVPAAPPPATPPARVTARIQKPAEAASAAVAATTRRAATGTQRIGAGTGGIKRTTGRVTGRITARIQGAPPKMSAKHKLIAVGGIFGVAALAGLMYAYKASQDDPEEIRAQCSREVQDFLKIPSDAAVKRYEKARSIVENEKFKKYALSAMAEIKKVENKLKEAAEAERQAQAEATQFISKYTKAKENAEAFDKQAENLYDELKPLKDKYIATSYAKQLNEIFDALQKYLANRPKDNWEKHWVKTTADVREAGEIKGDFVGAVKILDDYGAKWNEKEDQTLFKKMKELRESLPRKADSWVEKQNKAAQQHVTDGKKDEAIRLFEAARPGLKGFPTAEKKLEGFIKGLTEKK